MAGLGEAPQELGSTPRYQWQAFHLGAENSQWLFSYRATDTWVYSLIPGLFLSIMIAFPVQCHYLLLFSPKKFRNLLNRPYKNQSPLRENMRTWSGLAWVVSGGLVVLNLACFDTFLQISPDRVRYSSFFSPITHEHPMDEISGMTIYALRRAPNSTITHTSHLDIELKNGEIVDTFSYGRQLKFPFSRERGRRKG